MSTTLKQIDGDPITLANQARTMQTMADSFEEAARTLRQVALTEVFISEAIDEVRLESLYAADATRDMHTRYRGTSEALIDYSAALQDAQHEVVRASRLYDEAHHDESRHRRMAEDYREMAKVTTGHEQEEALRLASDRERLADIALADVHAAEARYQRALETHDHAAARATTRIVTAIEESNLSDGFWDDFQGAFKELQAWCQENLAPIFELLKEIASKLSEILGWVALALAVLAVFFPPLAAAAAIVAVVALTLSAVALLLDEALFLMGESTAGSVVSGAISVAIGALTLGRTPSGQAVEGFIARSIGANLKTEGGQVATILVQEGANRGVVYGLGKLGDAWNFDINMNEYNPADPLGGPLWTRPDSIEIPSLPASTLGGVDVAQNKLDSIGAALESGDYRLHCDVSSGGGGW